MFTEDDFLFDFLSDMNSTDFGSYCVEHGNQVVTGKWSVEEAIRVQHVGAKGNPISVRHNF